MSGYENKPNTGCLFRNDKRSEKAPDWRGPYYDEIGGEVVEREIAAWERTSKSGKAYLSIKVGDRFVPNAGTNVPNREQPPQQEREDLPF
jgi:uncharacterized protein (DUF736 family)